jgi:pimeloyl-ACP methyl ester carboxylesterase
VFFPGWGPGAPDRGRVAPIMIKVLITLAFTLTEILGIQNGRYFNRLQIFGSRLGKLLGRRSGCSAYDYTEAGGHQLRTLVSGCGVPTVVFEAGGYPESGVSLEEWKRVQPEVSRFTTTFSYDRAGIGLSGRGPQPRDARQIARELHTTLRNANLPPPYMLVGHSFGGPLIRVFAGLFPAEVCGMVLVDPTQEEFINWHGMRAPHSSDEDWRDIRASLAQAHESRVPEGIPVVLITATGFRVLPIFSARKKREELEAFLPMWLKCHREWVEKLPNARHLVTNTAGHLVNYEEPQVIVSAIREVVEYTRRKIPREVSV